MKTEVSKTAIRYANEARRNGTKFLDIGASLVRFRKQLEEDVTPDRERTTLHPLSLFHNGGVIIFHYYGAVDTGYKLLPPAVSISAWLPSYENEITGARVALG